jgi:hypothetical protein
MSTAIESASDETFLNCRALSKNANGESRTSLADAEPEICLTYCHVNCDASKSESFLLFDQKRVALNRVPEVDRFLVEWIRESFETLLDATCLLPIHLAAHARILYIEGTNTGT